MKKKHICPIFLTLLCLCLFTGCNKDAPRKDDIYELIGNDDIVAIKKLLSDAIDLEKKDFIPIYQDITPLFFSAICGRYEIAEILLKSGANVDTLNYQKWTPLYFVAMNGKDTRIAQLLIDYGADVHHKTDGSSTPLHAAATNGNLELIKILIDYGADVNDISMSNRTPLDYAALEGNTEAVKLLVRSGAELWPQDGGPSWPYSHALGSGNIKTAEAIVSMADISKVDNNGHTIFHKACIRGDLQLVEMLVKLHDDLNINQRDLQSSTPLDLAIRCNPQKKKLHQFLKKHGARIR
ncbi:MAG: ankyrin repeat domain-containing protein [Planctomycetes bacterium]|nr:ankyrin repeat domain-containing protein [Planctomycetota bacterium]